MKVAVIGGGPSGLVTLKYLLAAHHFQPVDPIEVQLFESEDRVGGTFSYRTYDKAELVSSAQLTTFSDYRWHDKSVDYLSAVEYVEYLEGYCDRFGLWPHIHLLTQVEKVERTAKGGHRVTVSHGGQTRTWDCDAVAVCSGLHVKPNVPSIPGLDRVPVVFHSSEYKHVRQLGQNTNVMVLGTGETGMDIAYFSVTADSTKSTTVCHRNGFVIGPKRLPEIKLFGRVICKTPGKALPVDLSRPYLFVNSYVHRKVRGALQTKLSRWTVKAGSWLVTGTTRGFDQWVGSLSKEKYDESHYFYCKSTKAMPYISAPYRSSSWVHRLRSNIVQAVLPDTGSRKIDLAPWPKYIDEDGVVHFEKTSRPESKVLLQERRCKPDVLVLATGYTQSFPFLSSEYCTPDHADQRGIWRTGDASVGYIGFVRPSFGAIPPLAEMQAQVWVLELIDRLPGPLVADDSYRLFSNPSGRIGYGVDHDLFAHRLALDIGAAPSFFQALAHGWKVIVFWAMGGTLNTKFRLAGPWAWSGAPRIIRDELLDTVTGRRSTIGKCYPRYPR
ncbi:dimethylaniline monooxygenase [Penicillium soppii]|uniref:dimethylaniline monooxygenase n=1 Tax=Penicillium soppii TaxID=69789 RepID=UPI002548D9BA|nr:dimethylaniline monooxygenase [Penicillium soppii]KAJ5882006.1 dimethylaniline monooxygenase [Penicillium soppii]